MACRRRSPLTAVTPMKPPSNAITRRTAPRSTSARSSISTIWWNKTIGRLNGSRVPCWDSSRLRPLTTRWWGLNSCTCSRRARWWSRAGQKASRRPNSPMRWPPNHHTDRACNTSTQNLRQNRKKSFGRRARGRRKKRDPSRGHYDKDRPAIIAWVSRQGDVVIHATKDFTVKTVQKAANLAVQAGSRLYTDSASSSRAWKGYVHEFVNHTQ